VTATTRDPIEHTDALPVDFRRPPPLGIEQTKTVRGVHEVMCELLSPMLTTRLGTPLRLAVRDLEMVAGEELATACNEGSMIVLLELRPLPTPIVLRFPMPFAMVVLDLLLGGPGNIAESAGSPSVVEIQIVERLMEHCTVAIDRAWSELLAVHCTVSQVTTNGSVVELLPLGDPFLRVDLEADVGGVPHTIDMWMANALLGTAFRAFEPIPAAHEQSTGSPRTALVEVLQTVRVRATVRFRSIEMTPAAILSLSPGDLVDLGSLDQTLVLGVGDTQIAQVRPARDGRRLSCQIVSTDHSAPSTRTRRGTVS